METEIKSESAPANATTPAPPATTFSASDAERLIALNVRRAEERAKHAARERHAEVSTLEGAMESIIERIDSAPEPTAEQIAEREQRRLKAELQRNVQERMQRQNAVVAQVGRRYQGCTLDNFEVTMPQQQRIIDALREFASDLRGAIEDGRNLVFMGPPGTGKDHLLVALLRQAAIEGWSIEWRDGQAMFGEFRDAIDGDKSEAEMLAKLTRAGVFAISDPVPPVGSIKSDYQRAMLFRIIDRRYRDLRPTWVTINAASASEAEDVIAPNIIDRLGHNALVCRCNWPSYRRKA